VSRYNQTAENHGESFTVYVCFRPLPQLARINILCKNIIDHALLHME